MTDDGITGLISIIFASVTNIVTYCCVHMMTHIFGFRGNSIQNFISQWDFPSGVENEKVTI